MHGISIRIIKSRYFIKRERRGRRGK